MPCDFTDIWNLKTKTNKQTKQNQTHRHREKKLMVARWERLEWLDVKGGGIKKYKLAVTKWPLVCKVQHKEYSE